MKKKFVAFALIIAAFVSVTSGCIVREGYYHHDRDDHHRDRDYHHDRDGEQHDQNYHGN